MLFDAMQQCVNSCIVCAQQVFRSARPDAKKVLFLITDGYSNGGDPKPIAETLRRDGVEIFTFGIKEGNFIELCDMASDVKHEHVYILNTFEEFEALARRALHEGINGPMMIE
jgi:CUB/sushi domain-containing protein